MRFVPVLKSYNPFAIPAVPRWASGVVSLDTALAGGLVYGAVHEIYAADPDDVAGGAGYITLLAGGLATAGKALVWLRTRRAARAGGIIQDGGLVELYGPMPRAGLVVLAGYNKGLLRASLATPRSAHPAVWGSGRMQK